MAQGGDERRGLPVAERDMRNEALALLAAAIARRHVGRGPGLVDEHQPARIEALLRVAPGLAGGRNVELLSSRRRGAYKFSSRRSTKRPTDDRPTLIPASVDSFHSSEIVRSGRARRSERTVSSCSARVGRLSPPNFSGRQSPVAKNRCISLITQLGLARKSSPPHDESAPPGPPGRSARASLAKKASPFTLASAQLNDQAQLA